jgi:antitoxin component of MazEF toxin-antitoxin module
MATDPDDPGDGTDSYTPRELRQMDDDDARRTLTVAQYERREKLLELQAEADETAAQFEAEAEAVEEITVKADAEALGTEVDIWGNTLLVRIPDGSDTLREHGEAVEDVFRELEADTDTGADTGADMGADMAADADAFADVDRDTRNEIVGHLQAILDEVIIRWDGTEWADLPPGHRDTVLHDATEKWGVDGLLLAVVDIVAAVQEDREERVSVMESFRGAPGRARR